MAKSEHSWLRRVLGFGVIAGFGYALWRAVEANRGEHDLGWEAQPFPFPPQPRHEQGGNGSRVHIPSNVYPEGGPEADPEDEDEVAVPRGWVAPVGEECPATHPIKAKLGSGIYHVPGGLSYDRTRPDRCYVDVAAAEADGLRAAKR